MKSNFFFVLMIISCYGFSACKRDTISPVVPNAGNDSLKLAATSKTIYYPASAFLVPANNDYTNSNSEFSNSRKSESANLAMFWAKEYGSDPSTYSDATQRFNPATALTALERFYTCYRDTLKFVQKGNSLTDQYKMLTYAFYSSTDGTAYGGGVDNKIGVLWTPGVRMNAAPYGALAHELGHSFQYMLHADGAWGYTTVPSGSNSQTIFEMTSQYMLFQNYLNWMTFENYHLTSFMQQTHLAFLHEDNQYHSPYVLEYWSNKRGRDFVGKLWRSAIQGEDPVLTYQRITGLNQAQFNDEMFDAYRHFITWDMARIAIAAKPYANQHVSTLNAAGNGWYRIAESNCPQNYGYNGIKLNVPASGTVLTLNFQGLAGAAGYRSIKVDKAGWRYGFLAVKQDGTRAYGTTYSNATGTATFTVPANTSYLWLIVSGAPTQHWEHLNDGQVNNDEQWPYQVKITGTTINSAMIK